MKLLASLLFYLGNPIYRIVKYLFSFSLINLLFLGFTIFCLYYFFFIIPPASLLKTTTSAATTHIYDRSGNLLYKIYKDKNRTYVPLAFIPKQVVWATLSAEDAEFYNHLGFSVTGISRALGLYLREGKVTGGSTITQQLVKNTLLTPERTLRRKLIEAAITIKVEFSFSKDQILEMYLNETPYGGPVYGAQEAAQTYFGKNIWDVSLAEAAFLAGLPKSPSRYSPFGSNPKEGINRQKDVLHLMQVNDYITAQQQTAAENETLVFKSQITDIKAPHFVMYVKEQLEEAYGMNYLYQGGLNVYTTLDLNLQTIAEKAITKEINRLQSLRVGNAAAVILQPQTGEVLAMVGSRNYFDSTINGQVNVLLSPRQAGSSIKPLTYSLALQEKLLTPITIIQDTPTTFPDGTNTYSPKNYDGVFKGPITMRNALAQSRNIPAVKTLQKVGVDKLIAFGQALGLSTWKSDNSLGLSLTLGGGDVKLLELAHAYSVFANNGALASLQTITKITNTKGRLVYNNECLQPSKSRFKTFLDSVFDPETSCLKQVLDRRVSFIITDILSDNSARTPAFGANSALKIDRHPEVAVKTGTSNSLRDNVTVGYSPNYLTAVWVGNTDNSPMSQVASGITGASPIWKSIMSQMLAGSLSMTWKVPTSLVNLKVCSLTGSLACANCADKTEWFLEENKPGSSCTPKVVDEIRSKNQTARQGELFEHAASTER